MKSTIYILILCTSLVNIAISVDTASNQKQGNSKYYVGLMKPQVRDDAKFDVTTSEICGGTDRGSIHFLTTPRVSNEFKWYIEKPVPDATCKFRLTQDAYQNKNNSFVVLKPEDRDKILGDGSFYCGGSNSPVETANFIIPDDFDCDRCVLEFIWRAPEGAEIRQCADIMVSSNDGVSCLGRCLNGGVCRFGKCICKSGYEGEFCEEVPGIFSETVKDILKIIFWILILGIAAVGVYFLLFFRAKQTIEDGAKNQIYHTNNPLSYAEFDRQNGTIELGNRGPQDGIKKNT